MTDIILRDPAGGALLEAPGLLIQQPRDLRVIGTINVECVFTPGALFVTPGAFEQVGTKRVIECFRRHLTGGWLTSDNENRKDNNRVARHNRNGEGLYDIEQHGTLMIVTYIGVESVLLLREEY